MSSGFGTGFGPGENTLPDGSGRLKHMWLKRPTLTPGNRMVKEMSDDELDDYPSETFKAVPPNDTTAGVDVTVYDMDSVGLPTMFEIHQYYPPEDGVEGDSVYFHGEHEAAKVIEALSEALAGEFEEVDWHDV